jgi:predicted MFS family arabinose efflux permease
MTLSPYLAIVRTPQVPRLVWTALIGRLVIGMSGLAIVLLVRHDAGSFALAGVTSGSFALGSAVAAPLVGRVVDHAGQTRALLACAVVCASAFTALALSAGHVPNGVLPALAAVGGATVPPIGACMRALWSFLIGRGAELQTAFAFEATVQEAVFILGPLLVVSLIAIASPAAAVLAIAAAVLTGTCLFAATPASRSWRPEPRERDWAGALRGPGVRTALAVITLMAAAFGVIEVAVPAVAEQLGSSGLSGLFLSLLSGGSMIGGLLAGALASGRGPERRVVVLLGALVVGLSPLALASRAVLPFALCMLIAGLGIAPTIACLYQLVDRSAPAGTVTEAFTWVTSAFTAGSAVGAAVAGSVVQHAGPAVALLSALGAVALATLLARARRPTMEVETPEILEAAPAEAA